MKDYKRILQGVVNIINITKKSDIGFANICAYIDEKCPELKESEGERIWIINYLNNRILNSTIIAEKENLKKAIAWLEKQCEQKPMFVKDFQEEPVSVWHNASEKYPLTEKEIIVLRDNKIYYGKYIGGRHEYVRAELQLRDDMAQTYATIDCLTKKDKWIYVEDLQTLANSAKTCKNEQNHVDKVEPKFHIGDWVVSPNGVYWHIDAINNNRYEVSSTDGARADWSLNTSLYRLWTIEDAKDGDVLVASDGSIFLFKGTIDCACKHYVALTTDNVVKFNEGLEHYWETSTAVHPATKKQRDQLEKAMADAGYTFDFEKKELKKIAQNPVIEMKTPEKSLCVDSDTYNKIVDECVYGEQKSAWSEEDESHIRYLIECLEHCKKGVALTMTTSTSQEYINWLKSLKPQNTWKPSDEQMDTLRYACGGNYVNLGILESLYVDLKKLRKK